MAARADYWRMIVWATGSQEIRDPNLTVSWNWRAPAAEALKPAAENHGTVPVESCDILSEYHATYLILGDSEPRYEHAMVL